MTAGLGGGYRRDGRQRAKSRPTGRLPSRRPEACAPYLPTCLPHVIPSRGRHKACPYPPHLPICRLPTCLFADR
ncbi:hypothetical protein HRbin11_01389 [bacterium HR11]|nr:hypothetical protein HRbin11_01389 [bacterium HR11]